MDKKGMAFFVYGTLRYGMDNWEWFGREAQTAEPDINAKAKGHIWWVSARNGYPVAKFGPKHDDGTVVGDVIWCDPEHEGTKGMIRMESNAGYSLKVIDVTLRDGTTMKAVAFNYERDTSERERIMSGDWVLETLGIETPDNLLELEHEHAAFLIDP